MINISVGLRAGRWIGFGADPASSCGWEQPHSSPRPCRELLREQDVIPSHSQTGFVPAELLAGAQGRESQQTQGLLLCPDSGFAVLWAGSALVLRAGIIQSPRYKAQIRPQLTLVVLPCAFADAL